jgi:hypothetical protein
MTHQRPSSGFPIELLRRLKYCVKILGMPGQQRHLVRWLRSAGPKYLLEEPSPWMTFDAIEILDEYLLPGMSVFEYGSGGSTLFWATKGASVVSVEHDPSWYGVVRNRLTPSNDVDYRLVEPEPGVLVAGGEPADPLAYASGDARYTQYNFKRYVAQIDDFPDTTFDLVSIDGRSRPSCIKHAVSKVKRNGLLVLDNAERSYYLDQTRPYFVDFQEARYPGCVPTTRHPWQTNIYRRDLQEAYQHQ